MEVNGSVLRSVVSFTVACSVLMVSAAAAFADSAEKFQQGQTLMSQNRLGDAIEAYTAAINEDPKNWEAFFRRGVAQSLLTKHREAIKDYSRAIELRPGDGNLYFYRAYAYTRVRDGEPAIRDADEALKLGCRDPLLYFARALALDYVGRFKEALDDALTYEKLAPDAAAGHQVLGDIYSDLGRFRESIAEYDKVLELDATNPAPYLDRGSAYASLDDLKAARTNYENYLHLVPDANDALVLVNRARAHNELGAHKEALAEAKRALALNPEEFTRNMLRCNIGWALVGMGQYREGIAELDAFLQTRPDYNVALRERSIAHMKLGQFTQAVADAQSAVKANRWSFDARLQLASALAASGRLEEALTAVGPALAMRPTSIDALKLREKCFIGLNRKAEADADGEIIQHLTKPGQSIPKSQGAIAPGAKSANRPVKDKWALIVGVSQFKDPQLNLRAPTNDAKDFSDYLIKSAHFAPDHVKVLTDSQATRANILSACGDKWLPRVAGPDDLVVIYVSTHGSPAECDLGGVSYLIAHDTNIDELYASGIPLQDLTAMVKKRVQCDRVVIILDACHSGAADAGAKGLFRSSNVDAEGLAIGSGQLVISSSEPDQRSWEFKDKPSSVFTRHLIDGLQLKGDKTPLKDAFAYLKDKVQSDVKAERNQPQVPVLKSQWEGDDLILGLTPTSPRAVPK